MVCTFGGWADISRLDNRVLKLYNVFMKIEELKAQLKALNQEYAKIKTLEPEKRKQFGEDLNREKQQILAAISKAEEEEISKEIEPIDLTAPSMPNQKIQKIKFGSKHPLMTEMDRVIGIYQNLGFEVVEPRQLDDEFHMFESLNFPPEHPARDGYDTFRTEEGFIPPAHTSSMQYRVMKRFKSDLLKKGQLAVVVPGRVFRNEDVDATHEHTFYQCEGVFISKTANVGQMLGLLKQFFEAYYEQNLKIRTQPGYFPFTEPSLEFLIEKPESLGGDGWLEMLGCGMVHPNVLKMAGIDPTQYRGFAWGGGIDRLVMLKHGIGDVRQLESGKLEFLKEF